MKHIWKTGFTVWSKPSEFKRVVNFHREIAPAVLTPGGTSEWYLDDDPRRKDDNGDSILYPDGHTDKPPVLDRRLTS